MTVKKKVTATPKPKTKPKPKVTPKPKPKVKPKAKKEPELKRKKLSQEEMFPFESFPFRLEYQDGKDTRICHFECEEHREKLINRYKLKKGSYFIDTLT